MVANQHSAFLSDINDYRQMEIEDNEFQNKEPKYNLDQNDEFMLDDPFIDEILMIQFFSVGSLKQRLELVKEYFDRRRPSYG
mgnify:CR=1 FL=1